MLMLPELFIRRLEAVKQRLVCQALASARSWRPGQGTWGSGARRPSHWQVSGRCLALRRALGSAEVQYEALRDDHCITEKDSSNLYCSTAVGKHGRLGASSSWKLIDRRACDKAGGWCQTCCAVQPCLAIGFPQQQNALGLLPEYERSVCRSRVPERVPARFGKVRGRFRRSSAAGSGVFRELHRFVCWAAPPRNHH